MMENENNRRFPALLQIPGFLRNKTLGFLFIFSLILYLIPVMQADAYPQNAMEEVFLTNNKDVTIFYSFSSEYGNGIPDTATVSFGDFPLESVRVTTIEQTTIPLNFLFLVDVSKTVLKNERDRVKAVIQEFMDNIPFRDRFVLQINTFGKENKIFLQPTSDYYSILGTINNLDPLFSDDTAYYPGAIFDTLTSRKSSARKTIEKFQIILVTDGTGYDHQLYTEKDMSIALEDAGIPLYVLGVFDTFTGTMDPNDYARLERIANNSGGAIASPFKNGLENWRLAKILMDSISGTYVITGKTPANFQADKKNTYDISVALGSGSTQLGSIVKTVKPVKITSQSGF